MGQNYSVLYYGVTEAPKTIDAFKEASVLLGFMLAFFSYSGLGTTAQFITAPDVPPTTFPFDP